MTNPTRPVRVYLAGKITNHENDWRRHIIGNVATSDILASGPSGNATQDTHPVLWGWDERPSTIPGVTITGPFFIEGEGHDGQHGSNLHGVGEYGNSWEKPRALTSERRENVVRLCRSAIGKSDLVYVWTDGLDTAYGTLVEIGYAVAMGKPVIMAPGLPPETDQWFAECITRAPQLWTEDPLGGLRGAVAPMLAARLEALCESPPEKALYRASLTNYPHQLTPQHTIGRYRIDFAIIDRKIAVEVDGLTYHNGQDSFIKDQQRQRDLQAQGWTVVRFAAKEVTDNPRRCLDEIARLAG